MKDPYSVLFSIGRLTVWHRDKGGVDGACVHFPRARDGDAQVLKNIKGLIDFDWNCPSGPMFSEQGDPLMSTHGIVLNCMWAAAFSHFKKNPKKASRWMQRNLFDILLFAENPVDSLHCSITGRYGEDREPKEKRVHSIAAVCYGYVIRKEWPWWKSYKLHVHHWRFSHPWFNWLFNRTGVGLEKAPSLMQSINW